MPTALVRPDPTSFAARLNDVLAAEGYDDRGGNKRLASEFGVKPPVVSDWRKGRYLPTPARVDAMATRWRIPYEWLYWGRGQRPSLLRGAEHSNPRSAQTDRAIDDLRVAVSALVALVAARSPDEASALSVTFRKHLPDDSLREGLLSELLSVLDDAATKRPPP